MRKLLLIMLVLGVVAIPCTSFANIYAAYLDTEAGDGGTHDFTASGDMDITYQLNEQATSATVEIFLTSAPGVAVKTIVSTSPEPGTNQGANTKVWNGLNDGGTPVADGTYSFRVIAEDAIGHVSAELINDRFAPECSFYSPRGVKVNMDPASEYFGTIYVCENSGGPCNGGARTTTSGAFALTNGFEDAIGQGADGRNGGVGFGSSHTYRCHVAEDGQVYFADWSDSTSNVYRAAGDLPDATWDNILTNNNRDSNGLCDNHGSICGVYTEGTGSSLVVFTRDEDMDVGTPFGPEDNGSIIEYAVGTATEYAATPPVIAAHDHNKVVNYSSLEFAKDATGDWWLAQYRWTDSVATPVLWCVDASDATTEIWTSDGLFGGNANTGGLDMSPDGHTILTADRVSIARVFDIDTKTITLEFPNPSGAGYSYGTAWDIVGNMYSTTNSAEQLRVVTPADGPNSYTTDYYGSFTAQNATPVSDWTLY